MAGINSISDKAIIRRLRDEGWVKDRINGSHQQWAHPHHPQVVTTVTTGMSADVRRSVYRQAGWEYAPQDQVKESRRAQRRAEKEATELRAALVRAHREADDQRGALELARRAEAECTRVRAECAQLRVALDQALGLMEALMGVPAVGRGSQGD